MALPVNYTTSIDPSRTVGEIQAMLARFGAEAIGVRYASGQPVGLYFTLNTPHGRRHFSLPVNTAAMDSLLRAERARPSERDRRPTPSQVGPEHAARVAWRVVKDWLAAQLSLVSAQMASIDQVMLPYMVVDEDQGTLYDRFVANERAAIESA